MKKKACSTSRMQRDPRIAHDRFGSSSDPNLNGQLHYPNDIDRSLNESAADKIRKYRAYYNKNPPNVISFMSAVGSTSGRLHSEFVRLLFLQAHNEAHYLETIMRPNVRGSSPRSLTSYHIFPRLAHLATFYDYGVLLHTLFPLFIIKR